MVYSQPACKSILLSDINLAKLVFYILLKREINILFLSWCYQKLKADLDKYKTVHQIKLACYM